VPTLRPVIMGMALTLIAAAPALAHTTLVSSSPGAGGSVATPPAYVALVFAKPIQGVRQLTVTNAAGRQYARRPRIDKGNARRALAGLTITKAGRYTVKWAIVGADTHTITGTFTFRVRASG
jgi:methionine-rich copper-binding protein CopC